MRIHVPDNFHTESIVDLLPPSWVDDPARTRALADAWLDEASCALLRVPSAIMPHTFNWILNPAHPLSRGLAVSIESLRLDQRLFKSH